jgi:hypothetical protein
MTDTFANGPGTPGGATPDATPQPGDVTGTLAELERKLRELESELSSIGRRRTLADAASAVSDAGETPRTSGGGRLVDEAIEPPAPIAPPPLTSAPPAAPVASVPVASAPAPLAQAPLAQAPPPQEPPAPGGSGQPVKFMRPPESARTQAPHATAQPERPRPSEAQLASLAELRRFRDRLERFARDLAAEYDALLGRVMSGLSSASSVTESTASAQPAEETSLGSQPEIAQETPVAASEPLAEVSESPEDVLFEGRVELGVGPFYDISSLSAFERRLASLPYVVEASVRRFEASHAVVDVRLAAPVALVAELRRTMESDFRVREVADGRILLTFDEP